LGGSSSICESAPAEAIHTAATMKKQQPFRQDDLHEELVSDVNLPGYL
jgi:hypothetical protein